LTLPMLKQQHNGTPSKKPLAPWVSTKLPSVTLRSMPEPPPQAPTVFDLTVHERVLLFCVATRTDWQKAGVPGETALNMIEKGLIVIIRSIDWRLRCAAGRRFAATLSAAPRPYAVHRNGGGLVVFCFAKLEDAQAFAERFGGERLLGAGHP
jgi:hypothetical protein